MCKIEGQSQTANAMILSRFVRIVAMIWMTGTLPGMISNSGSLAWSIHYVGRAGLLFLCDEFTGDFVFALLTVAVGHRDQIESIRSQCISKFTNPVQSWQGFYSRRYGRCHETTRWRKVLKLVLAARPSSWQVGIVIPFDTA